MTLIAVEEAQALALAHAEPCLAQEVGLREAAGRILAQPAVARFALPGVDVSVMDGYACTLATLRAGGARVVGESAAGHPWPATIEGGAAVRISTGAVVPPGADLVVAQEDVTRDGDELRFDPGIIATAVGGKHIRRAGSDVRTGEVLVVPGQTLGPAELALLGGAGVSRVQVSRRPRVAILSTGDELLSIGDTPEPGGVISTNGLMLATLCAQAGASVIVERTIGDEPRALAAALDEALATADVVLTSGGASVGDHDHLHAAARRVGFEILAWGIALRPGKPTGIVRTTGGLWFALPGNPASTFVAFELFVRPTLRRMLGVRSDARRALRRMTAGGEFLGERTREHWVRAWTTDDIVAPLPDQLSGNLRSLATADALVRVPAGCSRIAPGTPCDVLVFDSNGHERPS